MAGVGEAAARAHRPSIVTGDPTRQAALALLGAVFDRRQPLEDALDSLPALDPRDRAAAHRLAATVLRRAGTLGAALDPFLRKAPPDPVRRILLLGAAGLLLLDTPPHAAVATSVTLARSSGFAPFAGLVNAVLRRLSAAGPTVLDGLDGPRLDTPPWLWSSWGAAARAIAIAHQTPAPLDLTLRAGTPPPEAGIMLPTGSVRFPPGTRPAEIPVFAAGTAWVQDAAAALPAHLLAVGPGERVADLCAAPGGKTAQLAAAGARVTAVERDPARIGRLRETLARTGLAAETVLADATEWRPGERFDAILLDAPCSATGTIRRHPDIAWLKRPRDIVALTAAQDRLLDAAAMLLAPGGRMIYAVCSLQPEEGEARIAAATARTGLRRDPLSAEELAALPQARTREGDLRTTPALWPEWGGMDGFFAARLRRDGQ